MEQLFERDVSAYFHCQDATLTAVKQCRCRWCGQRVRLQEDEMLQHVATQCSRERTPVKAVLVSTERLATPPAIEPTPLRQIRRLHGARASPLTPRSLLRRQPLRAIAHDKENAHPSPLSTRYRRSTEAKPKRPLSLEFQGDMEPLKKKQVIKTPRVTSQATQTPTQTSESKPKASEDTVAALLQDLTIACMVENVPLGFLSSDSFQHAMKKHTGVALPRDASSQAMRFLRRERIQADAVNTEICEHDGALTLVVTSTVAVVGTSMHSYMSFYVVNEERAHSLLSTVALKPEDDWMAVIQTKYEELRSSKPQAAVHLCLSAYPTLVLQRVAKTLFKASPSSSLPSLVGGCMAIEGMWLLNDVMAMLTDAPQTISMAAKIAAAANAVDNQVDSGVVVSLPQQRPHFCVQAVWILLSQLVQRASYLQSRWGREEVVESGDSPWRQPVTKLQKLLNEASGKALWSKWAALAELLAPFAALEALTSMPRASNDNQADPSPVLTSGVLMSLEVAAFQRITTSPLLSADQREKWQTSYLQLLRSRRHDHHVAALLLDPRLRGTGLSALGRHAALNCVLRLVRRVNGNVDEQQVGSQISDFLNQRGVFDDAALWCSTMMANPMTFWRSVKPQDPFTQVAALVCGYAPFTPPSFDSLKPLADGEDEVVLTAAGRLKHTFVNRDMSTLPLSARVLRNMTPSSTEDDFDDVEQAEEADVGMYSARLKALLRRMGQLRSASGEDSTTPTSMGFQGDWIDLTALGRHSVDDILAQLHGN
ncbi:hypothetical protein Poli38472_011444 [Pythium oligandrum]|uniref:Uncharacterized protein n=1 Tax=Pythium oligandrum TaxID=41045 RepID=A0A8K1CK62_PYTOL|nr:hypothetical protein Poli38472_011444 [Pythium oligandrum]|eukprot:TMW64564.1 hypothetical protein Poli38472_011444 [Pythium oligandrum]